MNKLENTLVFILIFLFSIKIYSNESDKLCGAMLATEKYNEAIKEANISLKKNGDNYKTVFCRGQANLKLNQFTESLSDFNLAFLLSKNQIDRSMATLLIGIVLKEDKQFEKALSHFNNSIENESATSPFKRLFLLERGNIYLMQQKNDEAANSFLNGYKLAQNDNERANDLKMVASAYAKSGNMNKAIEYQIQANLAFERTGLMTEYAESGITLALYYFEYDDLIQTERTLFKFERFTRDNGGLYFLAKILHLESLYYSKKSNLGLSKSKLDEAKRIAEDIGADDLKNLFSKN